MRPPPPSRSRWGCSRSSSRTVRAPRWSSRPPSRPRRRPHSGRPRRVHPMWVIDPRAERVTVAFVADAPSKADVLVVFGITGDLAKVMTFRSLYRLEQRGLLDCPIVGVAVDDWSLDQLVQRARDSIVGSGEGLGEQVF